MQTVVVALLLVGIVIGALRFSRGNSGEGIPDSAADTLPSINIGRIPIRGGIGAGILILILLTAVLIELPVLRWIALPGILAGFAVAVILIILRKHRGE